MRKKMSKFIVIQGDLIVKDLITTVRLVPGRMEGNIFIPPQLMINSYAYEYPDWYLADEDRQRIVKELTGERNG